MAGQNVEGTFAGRRVDDVRRAGGRPVVLAGSAFALGLVTGLFLKDAAKQIQELARGRQWRHDHERTLTYEQNLPDSLERREPAPRPGQPRYGGTGALGVSPAAADTAPSGKTPPRARDDV
jgi:hypothetical protein